MSTPFNLLAILAFLLTTCGQVKAGLFGKKTRVNPGPVRALYDGSPAAIVSYEGTLSFSSFTTTQWKQDLDAKGMKIALTDLESIQQAVKHAIVGEYGEYSTYVQPDTVGYLFGAWKVQVYVNKIKNVWRYRIVQGEKSVTCSQTMHKKVTRKYGLFKKTKNKQYDQNVACTVPVVGGLLNSIVDQIDEVWKQAYPLAINHTEL